VTAVARWQSILDTATTTTRRARVDVAVREAHGLPPWADAGQVADAADHAYQAGRSRAWLAARYVEEWHLLGRQGAGFVETWRNGLSDVDRPAGCPDGARTHLALGQACEACGVSVGEMPSGIEGAA